MCVSTAVTLPVSRLHLITNIRPAKAITDTPTETPMTVMVVVVVVDVAVSSNMLASEMVAKNVEH